VETLVLAARVGLTSSKSHVVLAVVHRGHDLRALQSQEDVHGACLTPEYRRLDHVILDRRGSDFSIRESKSGTEGPGMEYGAAPMVDPP
jgi:hypothetical protein